MTGRRMAAAVAVTAGIGGFLFAQAGQTPPGTVPGNRYSAQVTSEPFGAGLAITDHLENKHYIYTAKGKDLELRVVTDLSKAGQARLENLKPPATQPKAGE